MKRLKVDSSSDSGDETISISRIKSQYKKKKVDKNESQTNEKKKSKKVDDKQPTLDKLVNKETPKRKTIDAFFTKQDPKKVKNEISSNAFFSKVDPPKQVKKEKVDDIKSNSKKKDKDNSIDDDLINDVDFDEEIEPTTSNPTKHKTTSPEKFKTPEKKHNGDSTADNTPQSNKKFNYYSYINRPKAIDVGSVEIPEGSPTCLMNLTFVITGVLQGIEREDAQSLIERHGGRVTKAVSGKTSYLIVGDEPGESKVNKAKQNGKTKLINEEQLFDMIRKSKKSDTAPANKNDKTESPKASPLKSKPKPEASTPTKTQEPPKSIFSTIAAAKVNNSPQKSNLSGKPIMPSQKPDQKPITQKSDQKPTTKIQTNELLVEKYRPKTIQQVIGQQGDKSPANKLFAWLKNWDKFYKNEFKQTNEDGSKFRAALLSGPPGIGKTTTAHLVAKKLGYDVIEMNASSTRSKTELGKLLPSLLTNQSILSTANDKKKICLIMDEVDGMAGNEDRGGVAQLIAVLRTSQTPLICICNDKQSQKLRSLLNYVYDLPFRKLTSLQVKAALKSVLDREGLSLPEQSLDQIINSTNCDVRQVLNQIQLWTASKSVNLSESQLATDASAGQKDLKLKIFDICLRVFSHDGVKTFTDKLDLFFHDYQLTGLFVQENYLSIRPYKAKADNLKTLKLISLAADSISDSDIVSNKLRSNNDWSLLPVQAAFASVLPGEYMHGRLSAQCKFPRWLGSYSSANKNSRASASLANHLRLSSNGGVSSGVRLVLDYGSVLTQKVNGCLREGDVESCINLLNEWQLMREDIDLLSSLVLQSNKNSTNVSTQVKSALTREYKKKHVMLPYITEDVKKKSKQMAGLLKEPEEVLSGAEEVEEEEGKDGDDSDINQDNMIVQKKAAAPIRKRPAGDTKESKTKSKASTSKKTKK